MGFSFGDIVYDFSGESILLILYTGVAATVKYFYLFFLFFRGILLVTFVAIKPFRWLVRYCTLGLDAFIVFVLCFLIYHTKSFGLLSYVNYLNSLEMDFATDNYILRPILVEGLMLFNISFRFDIYGLVFILIVFLVSDYILLYSIKMFSSIYIYSINFLVVLGAVGTFLAANLFTFTIFMEITSVGIFIYILQSYYTNKTKSAYIYLIYSFGSGVFLIAATCLLSTQKYGGDFYLFQLVEPSPAVNTATAIAILAFFIKIPTAPFHHWLLHAHTEATTAGSILLAAVLLKIPAFGIFRVVTTTPAMGTAETIVFIILLVFSIITALYSTIREFDLKRIVALSSIVHMNIYVLLLFLIGNTNTTGIFVYFLIVHTFTAGLLFFVFGILVERVHTRNYKTILGVLTSVPKLKTLVLISVFFYGALPISGIFSLELTLTQVTSYRLGYAIAGVALLFLSAVFIKILIVVSQLNSQHNAQKFSPADIETVDTILCFTIFIVLICLLVLDSTLVNIFLECSCCISKHRTHSIKLPLKLKRIFTRRGYRFSHKDPQEPERDWAIGGESGAIKASRLQTFHLNALRFRERIGTFGFDQHRYFDRVVVQPPYELQKSLDSIYTDALIGREKDFKQFESKPLNINICTVRNQRGVERIKELSQNELE